MLLAVCTVLNQSCLCQIIKLYPFYLPPLLFVFAHEVERFCFSAGRKEPKTSNLLHQIIFGCFVAAKLEFSNLKVAVFFPLKI